MIYVIWDNGSRQASKQAILKYEEEKKFQSMASERGWRMRNVWGWIAWNVLLLIFNFLFFTSFFARCFASLRFAAFCYPKDFSCYSIQRLSESEILFLIWEIRKRLLNGIKAATAAAAFFSSNYFNSFFLSIVLKFKSLFCFCS